MAILISGMSGVRNKKILRKTQRKLLIRHCYVFRKVRKEYQTLPGSLDTLNTSHLTNSLNDGITKDQIPERIRVSKCIPQAKTVWRKKGLRFMYTVEIHADLTKEKGLKMEHRVCVCVIVNLVRG